MPHLYALLTGINHYHPAANVPALKGCHSDIQQWKDFLEAQFPIEWRHIECLLDGDSTYDNVVEHFGDKLLGRAGKDDIVLFAYSGHGSREGAAPEFDAYYPEGLQETLVLYDSRAPGGLDLADKELALLLERIARTGAHVVLALDCCHAGSGTRFVEDIVLGAVRQHTGRSGRRPLESYLHGAYTQQQNGLYLPASRHILLAACDRTQKAWETAARQGLFTASLMKALQETGGRVSYADLYRRCRIGMSGITGEQHPQFEPSGFFNAYEGFLGLSGSAEGATLRVFFGDNTWQATMGALDGLPVRADQPAVFEVLQDGAVLGTMRSSVVGADKCSLEQPDFPLPPADYEARLRSLSAPKMPVQLICAPEHRDSILSALDTFRPRYFELQEQDTHAPYRMESSDEEIRLLRFADGALLRRVTGNDRQLMLDDAFVFLEHIARWERTVALDNPDTHIDHGDLELIFVELDGQGNVLRRSGKRDITVDIPLLNGQEQPVPFRLELCNKGGKARHCALYYASGNYGFFPVGFQEKVRPDKDKTVIAWYKDPLGQALHLQLNGKTESTDIFKLFVSNTPIQGEGLTQKSLVLGETAPFRTRGGEKGTRDPEIPRDIGGFGLNTREKPEDVNDWYCITMRVRSAAREAEIGERAISLANQQIRIAPHPAFQAGVSLGVVGGGSRSVEPLAVAVDLARYAGAEMLTFGGDTRSLAPSNMLELTNIQGEESLQDNPLEIELSAGLKADAHQEELLLPLSFDGEHLLPVGFAERTENGHALVRITHLPDTTDERRRSLSKALKLCFLKLTLQKKHIRTLCWVDYTSDTAERRPDDLKDKVKGANRILLLVHGIIGDTGAMAESMRPLVQKGPDGQVAFDLVLTFDYENLNTPIQNTAGFLEAMLRDEAGIHADSGKKITIVAHSMGGLVSRIFIENMKGNMVVEHLVMAGTPNGGSAISKIVTYRDYAIPLLTLLVNLPWGIPAAATVLGVLQQSKNLTVTLSQMDYDRSDDLKNLNKGPDPHVRYSIIAGNLHAYLKQHPDRISLMDKAYQLGGKLFYDDTPNDIAVSLDSIRSVPADRTPPPQCIETACHHLNYFEVDGGWEIIVEVLKN